MENTENRQGSRTWPVALSVAGSDNSSGAGIQADLKTFSALGVYGLTTVTCVVAEIPGRVERIQAMESGMVEAQNRLALGAYPVAAVKTGMLWSAEIIEETVDSLDAATEAGRGGFALVVDPVMVASSGDSLLREDAVGLYKSRLLPKATVVTPNLDEAAALIGHGIKSLGEMREAGRRLAGDYGVAFLLKGGHLPGKEAVDMLFLPGGEERAYSRPFLPAPAGGFHGSGCCYSAAIAAWLAHGLALPQAVGAAKAFLHGGLERALRWAGPEGEVVAIHQMWGKS